MTNKTKKGFTFIETILYIAISSVVVGVLFAYGWNMVSARTKAATMRDTAANARLIMLRLNNEIRMATDIDKNNSVFEGENGKISLTTPQGKIMIESIGDRISIARGENSPQFLSGENVRVRNFQLSKQENDAGKVQYVGFSFTVEAYYPEALNSYEYNYSLPINSGAEVRSQ
ncbi:MAG: hypothetical protein HGA36_01305 [Candidatus Moranbacteria bacterium]|nr:hypothetical protein [Candidatus Moranbacteria bacterium]